MCHENNSQFEFIFEEFEPKDLSYSNSILHTFENTTTPKPSLKCTGRGGQPCKPTSVLQLRLPAFVVQSNNDGCGRGRGRGHVRALDLTSTISSSGKSRGAVSSDTPLKQVLATANERFKTYGMLKRNPASAATSPRACPDIQNIEHYPSLPSMNFKKFAKDSNDSDTLKETCTTVPTSVDSIISHTRCGTQIIKSVSSQSELSTEATPKTTAKNSQFIDDTAAQINALYKDMTCISPSMNILAHSTPSTSPSKSRAEVPESSTVEQEVTTVTKQDNVPCEYQMVRIENLPLSTTQDELEEIICPYGQVLDIELELRISDGDEFLSAEVKLADKSIAEYLACCLDGAETIFEGTHSPVKCYVK